MIYGLYSLFLKRISEIKTKKEIIPFPLIFQKICRSFSITKQECWEVLFLLKDTGFIEIYETHGIKIIKKDLIKKEEKAILKAREIPKICINKCDHCHKEFEAEITLQGTCNSCSKEIGKRINEKIKNEIERGSTNPKWVIMLNAMKKEYNK